MYKTIGLESKCVNQWWLLRREARSASTDPSLPIMWPCHVILSSFLGHDQYPGQSWSIVLLVINLLSLLISIILGSSLTALLPQYEWTNAPTQLYYGQKYIKQAQARIVLNWRTNYDYLFHWWFIPLFYNGINLQANINKCATVCFFVSQDPKGLNLQWEMLGCLWIYPMNIGFQEMHWCVCMCSVCGQQI